MSISDLVPWNWGAKSIPVHRRRSKGDLRDPFGSLFEDFFTGFGHPPLSLLSEEERFIPRVNVKDTEQAILVSAEVPGMEEEDLDITLEGDSLVIKGEKKIEHEENEEEGYHYVERCFGSFKRVVPLNVQVDEDSVKASFKNGVLQITLPKAVEHLQKTRKISVETK